MTTINGAKVLDDKKDIEIPQGMAHAVDRVMFPLPVGDIVQTLQSDRERRFTNFLRALFAAGLADSLQGEFINKIKPNVQNTRRSPPDNLPLHLPAKYYKFFWLHTLFQRIQGESLRLDKNTGRRQYLMTY